MPRGRNEAIVPTAGLRLVDGLIWTIIGGVAALVLAVAALSSFHVVLRSFLLPALGVAVMLAGYWLYEYRRTDPRLAGALACTAQIIAFAAVGAPLSYIGASLGGPLYDHWFEAADSALGFDWPALLAWMNSHAAIHPLFRAAYLSLLPQTAIVVLALAWIGRLEWLRVFALGFVLAALATIAIAAMVPAQGVWGLLQLRAADYPDIVPATRDVHLPIFFGLRDGSYRQLTAAGAVGLITFPSFHTALAVILTLCAWQVPFIRWGIVAINAIMLISIPVDGGHYFVDMIAGGIIAVLCFLAARALVTGVAMRTASVKAAFASVPTTNVAGPAG
ncbi:MAG: phosphatase PAP2 family protein [Pseudolabrys sp.]|nr:phosphatase PAP2 family protein [Pseudolabrys sp.]